MVLKQNLEKCMIKMSRPASEVAAYSCKIELFSTSTHKLDWDSKQAKVIEKGDRLAMDWSMGIF